MSSDLALLDLAAGIVNPPLVIDGMPNEAYHAGAGISKSGLDLISVSPLHYYALTQDPRRPTRKEKPGQLEGTLAHCALLEPAEFAGRYPIGPDVNRNTAEWKAFARSLVPGQTPIKPEQAAAAQAQAASMLRIPDVAKAVETGSFEQSVYALDPVTGELVRCRPDIVQPVGSGVVLWDVKTFTTPIPAAVARQIPAKRYDVQAAFYSDVYTWATGLDVLAFVFLFVDTDYPFAALPFMLYERALDRGRQLYRRDLNLYAECRRAGNWPGFGTEVQMLDLPGWAYREEL